MRNSLVFKLFLVFVLLIAVDMVDLSIKSDLNMVDILSKALVRGTTLITAWIFIRSIK
jgi:hypothetical protein